jgi:hypothetical protein
LTCASLGPLTDEDQVSRARAALRPHDPRISLREALEPEIQSYMILSATQPSLTAAGRLKRQLEAAGFKDLWLIRDGEHANRVSAGLYSTQQGAIAHQGRLAAKGFDVAIVPRTRGVSRFWLDADLPAEALSDPALQEALDAIQPGLRLKPQSCRTALAEQPSSDPPTRPDT